MPIPAAMATALAEVNDADLPGELAFELTCVGAAFHSPTPLLLHRVLLPGGRTVHLCATCRDNVAVLDALIQSHSDELPWPVRRSFGNRLRALLFPKEVDG